MRQSTQIGACAAVTALAIGIPLIAGPLTPPNPPADTKQTLGFKTLREVEPRRIVNRLPGDSKSLHVISENGSYYLDADIVNTVGDSKDFGVKITAERVTLDLSGFRVVDESGAGDIGVHADPTTLLGSSVTIHDGVATGWLHGVETLAESAILTNLRSVQNRGDGFRHAPTTFDLGVAMLSDCVSADNAGSGFVVVGASLVSCAALNNAAAGFDLRTATVRSCVANSNAAFGFIARGSSLVECEASDNGGAGEIFEAGILSDTGVVRACVSKGSAERGFVLLESVAEGCVATLNGADGFLASASRLDDCVARSNGDLAGLTGVGFDVAGQNLVTGCLAIGNGLDGFSVRGSENTLDGNASKQHPAAGQHGYFFTSTAQNNVVVCNFASGNWRNFSTDFAINNVSGGTPIISLTAPGPFANIVH